MLDKHNVTYKGPESPRKMYPKYHVLRTKFGIHNERILEKLHQYYKRTNFYVDYYKSIGYGG